MKQSQAYFSPDYSSARQTFLAAAQAVGAAVESFRNPVCETPELYTDVAVCGPEEADNALVLMSGLHGVEGFAGSAIQTGLLTERIDKELPTATKLVMVHAINPYGFAYLRRFNEDNIDLNRNFIDHDVPYPDNPGYERLAGIVEPVSLSPITNFLSVLRIGWLRIAHGTEKLQQAVTYGQYTHPKGLFFGGRTAAWSNRTLHHIVGKYLGGTKKVVVVDLHTGLGPYGVGEIILNDPVEDPAYKRACEWWGDHRVKSTVSGESVSAHLVGTVKLAFDAMLNGAEVTGVGLEFGTLPPVQVFMAMREENWLHHNGGADHPAAARIKARLRHAFYPDEDVWRERVWQQGKEVVDKALRALS